MSAGRETGAYVGTYTEFPPNLPCRLLEVETLSTHLQAAMTPKQERLPRNGRVSCWVDQCGNGTGSDATKKEPLSALISFYRTGRNRKKVRRRYLCRLHQEQKKMDRPGFVRDFPPGERCRPHSLCLLPPLTRRASSWLSTKLTKHEGEFVVLYNKPMLSS